MPQRRVVQLSRIDGALLKRRQRRCNPLAEVHDLVDWALFTQALSGVHCAAKGEAAYPPPMMFKVVLLLRWYGLSDPAMEAPLFDRMSFLSFVGLAAEDETPDHATTWRLRQKLADDGLIERLFAELARQLERRGVMVTQSTLIDASNVSSAAQRPRMAAADDLDLLIQSRHGARNRFIPACAGNARDPNPDSRGVA